MKMIGKTILYYRILKELGRGGMGVVYKANDTRLKRDVAIKFLPQHISKNSEEYERFKIEAQAAAALNHPNITTIHAIEELDTETFIVMEFIAGQELKEKIGSGPMPLDNSLEMAIQVAEGLQEAHEKGVVHRDIKPSNIMLTARGLVKVMDFGLAKLIGQTNLTQTGSTLGTVAYMSPEQAKGERVDHRTDIWALGVVLYEMLTAQLPFKGEYYHAILYAIINTEAEPITSLRAGLPMELERIIHKTLSKNKRERYQQVEKMLADLKMLQEKIKSGQLETKTPPSQKRGATRVSFEEALKDLAKHSADMKSIPIAPFVVHHTVGRTKELARVYAGFESACNGRGQLLCVTGEAGIGKTTLITNFFIEMNNNGQSCFIARGQSSERLAGTEGYLPILESLESLLNGGAGESISAIMKRVAPTWYIEVATVSAKDPSDARVMADARAASPERKKRELAVFLQEISLIQPIILFFDDLHWADVSTIDVLSFIGSKCDSMRLLIVVAYRPTELLLSGNKFDQVKLTLQAKRVCFDVSLEFLSVEDVKSYLELEFPEHHFPEEFAELIYNRTEGSPLFMVDLIRNMRDREEIIKKKGKWVLKQSLSEIKSELPESIRSMIQRKIEMLNEVDHRLLVVASVQGQEFDSAVLAKVSEMDSADVEERLEQIANVHSFVRLVKEYEFPDLTPTLRFSFVHILYQNSFYDSLSMTRKVSMSMSVAKVLLGFYGEKISEVASEIAFLFEIGRDFVRASDYFISAAQNAVQIYANQEAIVLFQKAIANAEKLKEKERTKRILNASLQLGQVHLSIGNLEGLKASIKDFNLAERVAEEEENVDAQIGAICGMAFTVFQLKQVEETRRHGHRALELARSFQSNMGVASAQAVLAIERMAVGDLDAAERYYNEAIPVLQKHGSPDQIIAPVSWRGFLYAWRLDYGSQQQFIKWALDESRKAGLTYQIVSNLFFLGVAFGNQGRISEALNLLNEGLHISELNNISLMLNRLPNCIGWLYSELQDLKSAEGLNNQSIKYSQEAGELEPEANARINLAHDYISVGELDTAFEHLKTAEQLYKKDVWFRWRYNIRTQAEIANYWIAHGDLNLATSHASASLQAAKKTLSRKYIALAKKILGDIAVLEDRVEEGSKNYKAALNILKKYPCPTIEWKILKASADLAHKLKDDSAASEYRGQAKTVIQSLADSVTDNKLRQKFLSSKVVRNL